MEQTHILLELSKYPKTKTHLTKFSEEFHIINSKYNDYSPIYTNGSKDDNKMGYTAICRKTKLKERLPDELLYTVWNYQVLI